MRCWYSLRILPGLVIGFSYVLIAGIIHTNPKICVWVVSSCSISVSVPTRGAKKNTHPRSNVQFPHLEPQNGENPHVHLRHGLAGNHSVPGDIQVSQFEVTARLASPSRDFGTKVQENQTSVDQDPKIGEGRDLTNNKSLYTHSYISINSHMAVDLNSFICKTAILREWNFYFRASFANPTFIFRGGLMITSFARSFAKENTTFANSEKKLSRGLKKMDNLYINL